MSVSTTVFPSIVFGGFFRVACAVLVERDEEKLLLSIIGKKEETAKNKIKVSDVKRMEPAMTVYTYFKATTARND